jgi:hypothetical protein
MSKNTILKELLKNFKKETGIKIDFRKDQFLENQYGATPTFNYDFAEKIVFFTYCYLEEYAEKTINYSGFPGWEYNLQMSVEALRTTRLKIFIEDKINDLVVYKKHLKK